MRASLPSVALAIELALVASCSAQKRQGHPPPVASTIAGGVAAAEAPVDAGPSAGQAGANNLAAAWFDTFERREPEALAARSVYPFDYRDAGTVGRPGGEVRITASRAEEMVQLVRPLLRDAVLEAAMSAEHYGRLEVLKEGYVPSWAERWRSDLSPEWRLFSVFYRSDAAAFSLLLLADSRGVRGLWKEGVDASAEVELSRKWLAALRERDVNGLQHLTNYPFELRDKDVEAHCGERRVAAANELAAAVSCLFTDRIFNEALTKGYRIEAALKRDFEPGVFDGWRRPEHADLWPTMALIGNDAGNEYDLTLLVSKTGVRAFWKRGSFVSND